MQFSRALLAKPSGCAIVSIFVSPDPTSPTAKYEVKLYHQMICVHVEGCTCTCNLGVSDHVEVCSIH